MTDCIRSLLNNCSHLKDFFVINHIKRYFFHVMSYIYYIYIYIYTHTAGVRVRHHIYYIY